MHEAESRIRDSRTESFCALVARLLPIKDYTDQEKIECVRDAIADGVITVDTPVFKAATSVVNYIG